MEERRMEFDLENIEYSLIQKITNKIHLLDNHLKEGSN